MIYYGNCMCTRKRLVVRASSTDQNLAFFFLEKDFKPEPILELVDSVTLRDIVGAWGQERVGTYGSRIWDATV